MMQFPLAGDMAPKQRGDRLKSPLAYFCQVRFLWRWARSFLRRLCLLIFAFRRFFSEPIFCVCVPTDCGTLRDCGQRVKAEVVFSIQYSVFSIQ